MAERIARIKSMIFSPCHLDLYKSISFTTPNLQKKCLINGAVEYNIRLAIAYKNGDFPTLLLVKYFFMSVGSGCGCGFGQE